MHITLVICIVNTFSRIPLLVPSQKPQQFCAAVARILREERLRKGVSLNALAARAGISYQIISYIEREMRTPKLDTLFRITTALGVDLVDLIRRAERGD